MSENAVNIQGSSQGSLAVSTSAAQTTYKLERGTYDVWCDVDVYIKVNRTSSVNVTTSTGYVIFAGNVVPVKFVDDAYLGAIAGASGTLRYHRVD